MRTLVVASLLVATGCAHQIKIDRQIEAYGIAPPSYSFDLAKKVAEGRARTNLAEQADVGALKFTLDAGEGQTELSIKTQATIKGVRTEIVPNKQAMIAKGTMERSDAAIEAMEKLEAVEVEASRSGTLGSAFVSAKLGAMKQAIALQAKKEDRPAEGHFVGNMTLLKEIVEFPESGGAHLTLWVAVKIDEVTPLEPAVHARLCSSVASDLEKRGDFPAAYQMLDKAMALAPNDAALWDRLGTFRSDQKDYSKAVEAFARAVELSPASRALLVHQLEALQKIPDEARAAEVQKKIDALPPDEPAGAPHPPEGGAL